MDFEIEYIEKLAKVINDNGLTEISLEDEDRAITIRKDLPNVISAGAPVAAAPVQAPVQAAANNTEQKAEQPKGKAIVSPMVGMFYSKPAPDAEPFVKVGDTVAEGDIVCIIEAMKMMNEIESEFSGKITEICVADGEPVEYGQTLMYVE